MDVFRKYWVLVKWLINGFCVVFCENFNMFKVVFISFIVGVFVLVFVFNLLLEKYCQKIIEVVVVCSQLEWVFGIGQLILFVLCYYFFGIGLYSMVNEKVIFVGVFGMVFVVD